MSRNNELIIHQRQHLKLCALHSLNNLLQDPNAFSKRDLDEICVNLTPRYFLNPHRHALPFLGDYDVNVLIAALNSRDFEVVWHDKRRSLRQIRLSALVGFIVNSRTQRHVGPVNIPLYSSHWFAVRGFPRLLGATLLNNRTHSFDSADPNAAVEATEMLTPHPNGTASAATSSDAIDYFDLDSKLTRPALIGDENALIDWLERRRTGNESARETCEILLVMTRDVHSSGLWQTLDSPKTIREQ